MDKDLIFCDVSETMGHQNSKTYVAEIIQIAAIRVSKDMETVTTFNRYVKPSVNPTLTQYCKAITGVAQKDVDSAKSFCTVYTEFEEWVKSGAEDVSFCALGKESVKSLQKEVDAKGYVGDMKIDKYFNFQSYLQSKVGKPLGLKAAFEQFGLDYQQESSNVFFEVMNLMTLYVNCISSADIGKLWFEQKMKYIVDQLIECVEFFTSSKDVFTVDIKPIILLSNKCSAMLETSDKATPEERDEKLALVRKEMDALEVSINEIVMEQFRAETMCVQWAIIKGRLPKNFSSLGELVEYWESTTKKYSYFYKTRKGNYALKFDAVRDMYKAIGDKLRVFKKHAKEALSTFC